MSLYSMMYECIHIYIFYHTIIKYTYFIVIYCQNILLLSGKTTTISTLTGMVEATSGEVSIYGFSLKYDLPAIRQLIGIW